MSSAVPDRFSPGRAVDAPANLAARPVVWLRWLLAILISYGSLYPFSFAIPASMFEEIRAFLSFTSLWSSLGDVVGNVLLFLPWGILAHVGLDGKRGRAWTTIVLGLVLALVLQLAQILVPVRDARLSDVFWNAVGVGLGYVVCAPMLKFVSHGEHRLSVNARTGLLVGLLWFVMESLPLVPGIDWAAIKLALKALTSSPAPGPAALVMAFASMLAIGCVLDEIFHRKHAALAFVPVLLALVLVKLVVAGNPTHIRELFAWAGGAAMSVAILGVRPALLPGLAIGGLLVGFMWLGLEPFRWAYEAGRFNWMPLEAYLKGNMLGNVQEFVGTVWFCATVLWLTRVMDGRVAGVGVFLVGWVAVVEFMQIWIIGRSADITPILTAVIVTVVMHHWLRAAGSIAAPVPAGKLVSGVGETRAPALSAGAGLRGVLVLLGITAALTAAIWWVVRQPGVPYNVRELFLMDAHPLPIAVFVLALLWLGGGCWVSIRVATGARRGWMLLPLLTIGAALVSLLLLKLSVTEESIADIAGSNNLHWWVVNRDIWGSWWASMFRSYLSTELVSPIERVVRFAAHYVPPAAFMTVALLALEGTRSGMERKHLGLAVLIYVPLLWLCKGIGFDWSSTDNLNELIALDVAGGLGGGLYLYLLVGLFAINFAMLSMTGGRRILIGALFTIVAIPLSWYLLNSGLSSAVHKYGNVFSGVQFLLGPDRTELLPETELFLRWLLVYVAMLVTAVTGFRVFRSLLPLRSDSARPSWRAG
jgi:glycopeptide antibiotics resistance protein